MPLDKEAEISEINKLIGMMLRYIRKSTGKSLLEVANYVGKTELEISQYEYGLVEIPAADLYLISRLFETRAQAFYIALERPEAIEELLSEIE